MDDTHTTARGLISAIESMIPITDPRVADVVLAAALRQLTAGIDWPTLCGQAPAEVPTGVVTRVMDPFFDFSLED